MKNLTAHWKLPAILCALVLIVCVAYWPIARFAFNSDLAKSGQFGETFGALNTLFTGLAFVVVMATLIQQWRQIEEIKLDSQEQRQFQLRLDLFDRRFRIYQAVSDFIRNVIFNNVGQQEMIEFDIASREAFFLFAGDPNLLNYLGELRQRAEDYAIWRSQSKEQGHPGGPASERRDEIRSWFQVQLDAVKDRFLEHLSFQFEGAINHKSRRVG